MTHSRDAVSNIRRPAAATTARARARDALKERKDAEKQERREEVRRLKALKRKEVEAKLLKLVEAAGESTKGLDGLDLDGDWDPAEHDRKMAEIYGDEYGENEVSGAPSASCLLKYADVDDVYCVGCRLQADLGR